MRPLAQRALDPDSDSNAPKETIAAGVLPPNEQPYSMLANNSGYAANMKGNSEYPTMKYIKLGDRSKTLRVFTHPGSLTISRSWLSYYLSSSRCTTSWSRSSVMV
uniref:Uncharacterized protein n=1 Tax=Spermophilus dauricus TaxID=99837 RepID=A0A8C9PRK5_SPEDA